MGSRADVIARRARRHQDGADRAMDGFVRTPAVLAEEIVTGHPEMGTFPPGAVVLEPSAGDGALVRAILDADADVHVIAVEPNSRRADALDGIAAEYPGRVTVHRCTFEDYAARSQGVQVDAVIANPPFGDSSRDLVWMDHIRMAWDMLRPGAQLVAVVARGYAYRSDRRHAVMRDWVTALGGRYADLPDDAFVESGTGVRAGLVTVARPMPARPDGLPRWLMLPAEGVPVAVPGRPHTSAAAALSMPVQEYDDRFDGSRPRVVRFAGTCFGCARPVWDHDDRGDSLPWEANSLDAGEYGQAGPSVAMCLACFNDGGAYAAALTAAAAYWTAAPADDGGPVVYPLDLSAGLWATVTGIDGRGWDFTITGRVMADPERVPVPGADTADRIAVRLRTARGIDVELYALESLHVIVRDVPDDVVPQPTGGPVPFGMPQPVPAADVTAAVSSERMIRTSADRSDSPWLVTARALNA